MVRRTRRTARHISIRPVGCCCLPPTTSHVCVTTTRPRRVAPSRLFARGVPERDRRARAAGAARAADAVHVVLDVARHVEVEHVRHARDVEPARRDVGRDHQRPLAVGELLERGLALNLTRIDTTCHMGTPLDVSELLERGLALELTRIDTTRHTTPLDVSELLKRGLALELALCSSTEARRAGRLGTDPPKEVRRVVTSDPSQAAPALAHARPRGGTGASETNCALAPGRCYEEPCDPAGSPAARARHVARRGSLDEARDDRGSAGVAWYVRPARDDTPGVRRRRRDSASRATPRARRLGRHLRLVAVDRGRAEARAPERLREVVDAPVAPRGPWGGAYRGIYKWRIRQEWAS